MHGLTCSGETHTTPFSPLRAFNFKGIYIHSREVTFFEDHISKGLGHPPPLHPARLVSILIPDYTPHSRVEASPERRPTMLHEGRSVREQGGEDNKDWGTGTHKQTCKHYFLDRIVNKSAAKQETVALPHFLRVGN